MSTTLIRFYHRVGAPLVLTNVTSVVLSDPTDTFGVERDDTSAVVVANNTALTQVSTGVYEHAFTDPALGLEYTYWLEWVYNGSTYRQEFHKHGSEAESSGTWADSEDVENIYGLENVRLWSNLTATFTDTDYGRVGLALEWADAYIHSKLSDSRYLIPLVRPDDSALSGWTLTILKDMSAKLAGYWVYIHRGFRDTENTDNKLQKIKDDVDEMLQDILDDDINLDARLKTAVGTSTHAQPVTQLIEENYEIRGW